MDRQKAIKVVRDNWPEGLVLLKSALETLIPELKDPELKEDEDWEKPNGGIVLEDFNEGEGFYKVNLAYLNKEQMIEIEELVKKWNPEFQESDENKIIDALKVAVHAYCSTDHNYVTTIPKNQLIAWLEKQGKIVEYYEDKLDRCTCENFNNGYKNALEVNGELIDKLVKYREWLISKTDWWTERENDKTNSNVGKHYCTGEANALISARAKFEEMVDYDSLLEKQGVQKPTDKTEPKFKVGDCIRHKGSDESYKIVTIDDNYYFCEKNHAWAIGSQDYFELVEQKPTDKTEPKFKVKYAGNEYNVFEVKDIAGVTHYGIEDEPNHIDYIKADSCEMIGGYTIKENGLSYPTKPAVFSEQTSTGKVETKFKVGNWYLCVKDFYGKGVRFDKGRVYYCKLDGCLQEFDSGAHIAIDEILYDYFNLWTIRDAKDGDVLATYMFPEGDWIGIYKQSTDDSFNTHCFLNTVGEFVINPNRCKNHGTHGLHPATKEQRDLLFSKMKEEGYYWDSEKKELKKIEQKPTDKTEPKFKVGDWIIFNGLTLYIKEVVKGYYRTISIGGISNSYDCDIDNVARLWTIQDTKYCNVIEFEDHDGVVVGIISFVNKGTVKVDVSCLLEDDKFKFGNFYALDTINPHPATIEQRVLLFSKLEEAGYKWDAEKKEWRKIEKKPAWSEEDEKRARQIERIVHTGCTQRLQEQIADWFKSIKERMKGE